MVARRARGRFAEMAAGSVRAGDGLDDESTDAPGVAIVRRATGGQNHVVVAGGGGID